MPTQQERKQLIDALRHLPAEVDKAVKGLNDQQLDTPYGPGKWTVRQVVHHLADSHMNAFIRFKLILTENNPTLKPYSQDDWAKLSDTAKAPVGASLEIIKGLHERWTSLMDSTPEPAWSRTAHHPEHGNMVLEDILKLYAHHGESHVGHIMGLRKAKGW